MEREPAPLGLKVTLKLQVPPPEATVPQVLLLIVKSPELPPVVEGVVLVAFVLELFVTVKLTALLDEPTLTEPKFSVEGERVTLLELEIS